jgi:hypothetical protein
VAFMARVITGSLIDMVLEQVEKHMGFVNTWDRRTPALKTSKRQARTVLRVTDTPSPRSTITFEGPHGHCGLAAEPGPREV